MEFIILIVIGWLMYAYFTSIGKTSRIKQPKGLIQKQSPPPTEGTKGRDLQAAKARLEEIIGTCSTDHPEAMDTLIWMAGSDGKVSQQELRIIIGFCERQGTTLNGGWHSTIDFINTGLNISSSGSIDYILEKIQNIEAKPIRYKAAFVGACEAIMTANKTSNTSKRKVIEAAHRLLNDKHKGDQS